MKFSGVCIFHFALTGGGGGKNISYWLVGEKICQFIKKEREYKELEVKKEIFTVLGGKISFWKKGGGAKI